MKSAGPYQFGIRGLLILTTVAAIVVWLARRIGATWVSQSVVAMYLIFFLGCIILRAPSFCRQILDVRRRWLELSRHRAALEEDAKKLKRDQSTEHE